MVQEQTLWGKTPLQFLRWGGYVVMKKKKKSMKMTNEVKFIVFRGVETNGGTFLMPLNRTLGSSYIKIRYHKIG